MLRGPLSIVLVIVFALIIALRIGLLVMPDSGATVQVDESRSLLARASQIEPANTVRITAFKTGEVEAPANFLISQSNASLPDDLRQTMWVPTLAYAVSHPAGGVVILDAGLRAGACSYGLRPIYWVPCRNAPGADVVSQLKASGVGGEAVTAVMVSHFHGDHISGLPDLLDYTDAPVLLSEAALKELHSPLRAFSGIASDLLPKEMKIDVLDPYWREDETFGRYVDVFGDGTLKFFETPGHTNGHLSAFVQGPDRPVLLTFDASHLQANFELKTPSGTVSSKSDAMESLARFEKIQAQFPDVEIIYGHEPKQWTDAPARVALGVAER